MENWTEEMVILNSNKFNLWNYEIKWIIRNTYNTFYKLPIYVLFCE